LSLGWVVGLSAGTIQWAGRIGNARVRQSFGVRTLWGSSTSLIVVRNSLFPCPASEFPGHPLPLQRIVRAWAPRLRSRNSKPNAPPERRSGLGGVGDWSDPVPLPPPRLGIGLVRGFHRSGSPGRSTTLPHGEVAVPPRTNCLPFWPGGLGRPE
jgi:hypothetical protein